MTYVLWSAQGLLAFIFLIAGGMKLVLPLEVLTAQLRLPGLFVRFIGVAEGFGPIGLILPGLLCIRPGLTPLAAAGLVLIMSEATVLTPVGGGVALALIPLVVGLLSTFIAYGHWRMPAAPGRARSSPPMHTSAMSAAESPVRVSSSSRCPPRTSRR
jgi:DoxX-like family